MMNPEAEKAALLQIHADDRRAHFETDVGRLMSHAAENFIYVGSGTISHITAVDMRQQFTRSFRNKYHLLRMG
jgi:hypothetical protein